MQNYYEILIHYPKMNHTNYNLAFDTKISKHRYISTVQCVEENFVTDQGQSFSFKGREYLYPLYNIADTLRWKFLRLKARPQILEIFKIQPCVLRIFL